MTCSPSFHLLWTRKVFRRVVDAEGPVLEPLAVMNGWVGYGMVWYGCQNLLGKNVFCCCPTMVDP